MNLVVWNARFFWVTFCAVLALAPCSAQTLGGEAAAGTISVRHVESLEERPGGSASQRGAVHESMPEAVRPDARYVFYLHGRIIEEEGPRPTHPEYGVYEYRAILDTLASEGAEVISEMRPPGAGVWEYGERVATQARNLIAAGVEAHNITVIGLSKGGSLAIIASSALANTEVNFVFLASCYESIFALPQISVAGRILSIYEASDELGVSCAPLLENARAGSRHEEIRIDTGARHGAFYVPRAEWVEPVSAWIQTETTVRD